MTNQMTDTRLVNAVAWGFVLVGVLLSAAIGLLSGLAAGVAFPQHDVTGNGFNIPIGLMVTFGGLALTLIYGINLLRKEVVVS